MRFLRLCVFPFVYVFFVVLSFVLPRNKRLWVFGNSKGFMDNPKYFLSYVVLRRHYRCIWLASSKHSLEAARQKGVEAYYKKSLFGLWYSARANVQFICNGFGDLNRALMFSSKVVTFWHGTPIKKIFLDADFSGGGERLSGLRLRFFHLIYFFINKFIFAYYASNSLEANLVACAARISKEKVRCFGSPRFDYIRSKSLEKLALPDGKLAGKKLILYAPTWREGKVWGEGFKLNKCSVESLSSVLQKNNCVLLVKPHPLTSIEEVSEWGLMKAEGVHLAADFGWLDINEIYPFVDILITDVSSSIFDFLLFRKPVLIFMPDKKRYLSEGRGIYDFFNDLVEDKGFLDWEGLIRGVDLLLGGGECELELGGLGVLSVEISGYKNVCDKIYCDLIGKV